MDKLWEAAESFTAFMAKEIFIWAVFKDVSFVLLLRIVWMLL